MIILTLDTSSVTAACGLVDGEQDKLLYESFINVPLTHSQTILPMTQTALQTAGRTIEDVDLLAVCHGPGSFTGVRIGVAAAKGLGFERGILCAPVSTLEALAQNYAGVQTDAVIAAVLDARRQQVYTALFDCANGVITRLTDDQALAIDDAQKFWKNAKKSVIFVGDGADLCYNACKDALPCSVAPPSLRYVKPRGIALAAVRMAREGQTVPVSELHPFYLRLPQAERELKNKQKNQ
ncbi:MAG: tRNA (adenosine(37)-N6)-threonylcarbamoyltransferase complex dimerization subunit type 1 TsaB [Clostridia bacterium]|nr:tRNA (adenosine(37)-N6)-threonylcarbamoyltransferase complex dimerization subunit type 1 TsaB [Clostridia bacterium]